MNAVSSALHRDDPAQPLHVLLLEGPAQGEAMDPPAPRAHPARRLDAVTLGRLIEVPLLVIPVRRVPRGKIARHLQVQGDDVRRELQGLLEPVLPVHGAAHHGDAGRGLQQRGQGAALGGRVIDDEDAERTLRQVVSREPANANAIIVIFINRLLNPLRMFYPP